MRRIILFFSIIYSLVYIWSISVAEIAIYLSLFLWFLYEIYKNKFRIKIGLTEFFLIVFLIIESIICFSRYSIKQYIPYMHEFFLFSLIYVGYRFYSKKDILLFVKLISFSLIVACFYGIYQYIAKTSEFHPRITGTLSIYMTYAGVLAMAGVFILPYWLNIFNRIKSIFLKILLVSGYLLILYTLILTQTRAAIMVFLVLSSITIFIKIKYKLKIKIFALCLILILSCGYIIFGFSKENKQRFIKMLNGKILTDVSFNQRVYYWKVGKDIIKDNLLIGVGKFDYFKAYDRYRTEDDPKELERKSHFHNIYIQRLVESGIISFVFFILFFIFLLNDLFKQRAELVVLGSILCIISFLIMGLTDNVLGDSEQIMFLCFIMSLGKYYV